MNANRIFFLIGGIAIVAVLLLGWFLGVSPLLDSAAAKDAERQTVEAENNAQQAVLQQMKDQYAQLDVLNAQLADLQLSVPARAQVEDFIDLILRIAHVADVKVTSITISEGTLYGGGGVAATAAPAVDANGQPIAPAATSVALVPSPGLAADLYEIPITIVIEGGPAKSAAFLQKIQRAQRLMLVNSVTLSSAPPTSSVSGYLFVVSSGLPQVTVPPTPGVNPAPGETPAPTDTATPAPTDPATEPDGTPTPTPTGTPAS